MVTGMQSLSVDGLPAFLEELRVRSLTTAVSAWRDEFGPLAQPDGGAIYRACRSITLLAYDRGLLLRCELHDADADRIHVRDQLTAAGITCRERCRNLLASSDREVG